MIKSSDFYRKTSKSYPDGWPIEIYENLVLPRRVSTEDKSMNLTSDSSIKKCERFFFFHRRFFFFQNPWEKNKPQNRFSGRKEGDCMWLQGKKKHHTLAEFIMAFTVEMLMVCVLMKSIHFCYLLEFMLTTYLLLLF